MRRGPVAQHAVAGEAAQAGPSPGRPPPCMMSSPVPSSLASTYVPLPVRLLAGDLWAHEHARRVAGRALLLPAPRHASLMLKAGLLWVRLQQHFERARSGCAHPGAPFGPRKSHEQGSEVVAYPAAHVDLRGARPPSLRNAISCAKCHPRWKFRAPHPGSV